MTKPGLFNSLSSNRLSLFWVFQIEVIVAGKKITHTSNSNLNIFKAWFF